jgi:hypothetical protein
MANINRVKNAAYNFFFLLALQKSLLVGLFPASVSLSQTDLKQIVSTLILYCYTCCIHLPIKLHFIRIFLLLHRMENHYLLVSLSVAPTKGTQCTVATLMHLLNYCAMHPDTKICYHASGMILYIHSDASYLSELEACSQAGGHHYLSNPPSANPPPSNGPILNIAKILCHVISSAAKAELGDLFLNAKEGTVL